MKDDMMRNIQTDKIRDELTEFLRQLSWPALILSRTVIKTKFQGDYEPFEVIIHIGDNDVNLIIDPVVACPKNTWGESVINLMIAMAQEINHVFLGIDSDGDLYVKVGIPQEQLNLERFYCLLSGLCQVAQNITVPILQANAFDNIKVA